MGRWTSDEHGCIYDEAGCFARLRPNKADRLATRHNADIDALTAERDELQRRLDAVVRECRDTAELKCYCEFDRDRERTMECEYCEEVAALSAIAEGCTGIENTDGEEKREEHLTTDSTDSTDRKND